MPKKIDLTGQILGEWTVIREATKEDLLLIIEVYKQQIQNFKKRLNTYLKRYGLSKLTTWTYLVD